MKYVLCYGDSNTWGCVPQTFARYDYPKRWPGVLGNELGEGWHIYENALNGRTTVFEDFIEEGRSGKAGLPVLLEVSAPLDLVLIMLGTNDCKKRFSLDPWDIGWGMDLLIKYVKRPEYGRDGHPPKIVVISPPHMGHAWDATPLGTVFGEEANRRVEKLSQIYAHIANLSGVDFFDAAPHCCAGQDCVHLLPQSHERLGKALALKVKEILPN